MSVKNQVSVTPYKATLTSSPQETLLIFEFNDKREDIIIKVDETILAYLRREINMLNTKDLIKTEYQQ